MMQVPHARLARNAQVSNADPLPKASLTRLTANLQLWCEFNSWQVCKSCKTIQPRDLDPQGLRKLLSPWVGKSSCIFCRSTKAPPVLSMPEDCLQNLPSNVLEAMVPVKANFGPLLESKDQFGRGNGYRFHSSMVTFSWQLHSIEDRVAKLFPAERRLANAALEWLWDNTGTNRTQSAFGDFWQEHEVFLQKQPNPDAKTAKRWLRFIEAEGLECALWPHLFTQRQQCMTWARLQSTTRQARGAHRSTLAERFDFVLPAEDEEGAEPPADVVGCKRHYMALIFSPVLDVSLSYEILHFSYDLNLWSDLGSKRNLQLGIPMRLMLKNHSFSSEYWKDMHRGLVDLTRQKGFPPVFSTHSPLEWSWPLHQHIVEAMEQGRRGRACKDISKIINSRLFVRFLMTEIVGRAPVQAVCNIRSWKLFTRHTCSFSLVSISFLGRTIQRKGSAATSRSNSCRENVPTERKPP